MGDLSGWALQNQASIRATIQEAKPERSTSLKGSVRTALKGGWDVGRCSQKQLLKRQSGWLVQVVSLALYTACFPLPQLAIQYYTSMCQRTHTYTHMYACIHTCMHTHTHMYACTHMHAYTKHTHKYTLFTIYWQVDLLFFFPSPNPTPSKQLTGGKKKKKGKKKGLTNRLLRSKRICTPPHHPLQQTTESFNMFFPKQEGPHAAFPIQSQLTWHTQVFEVEVQVLQVPVLEDLSAKHDPHAPLHAG